MSLSSILKRLVEEAEPVADAGMEPEFDFSHVPKTNTEEPEVAEPVENIPEEEPEEAPEEVVEEPEAKTTRLLSIDQRKVNLELKEICAIPSTAIPLSKIKEVLTKYKLKIADAEVKFVGRAGNKDFSLTNDKDVAISNSMLVIYWNRDGETSFTVNVYLS